MSEAVNVTNVLLATIGFLIVYTLNGIKSEIKEVRDSMNTLSLKISHIDTRVTVLESK
jgi:hypothetical protein